MIECVAERLGSRSIDALSLEEFQKSVLWFRRWLGSLFQMNLEQLLLVCGYTILAFASVRPAALL